MSTFWFTVIVAALPGIMFGIAWVLVHKIIWWFEDHRN